MLLGTVFAPDPRDVELAIERDAASLGGVLGDQLVNICTTLPLHKAKDLQHLLNTGLCPVNQPAC